MIDSIEENVHDSHANAINKSAMIIFLKRIAEDNLIFFHIFQKRQSFKCTCLHNGYVDGLITKTLMNNRSCNTMKTYTETYPVGRFVNHEHGYYYRAGFD